MAVSSEIPGGMVGSAILGQHKAPAARSTLNTGGDNYEYWPIYTGISIAVCLPAALRSSSVYQSRCRIGDRAVSTNLELAWPNQLRSR